MARVPRKIFLSHTSELGKYPSPPSRSFVRAAKDAINRAGDALLEMEYFPVRDQTPASYSIEQVKQCDIYIGVVGLRYGSRVKDENRFSYVRLEYEAAKKAGLTRLIFLLDEEIEGPRSLFDNQDKENSESQKGFREALLGTEDLVVKSFKTSDKLESEITRALGEVPDQPWPPPNLPTPVLQPVGREKEIEDVVHALELPTSFVLTGISGMGKTTILTSAIRKIERSCYGGFCFHRIAERDSIEERLNRLLVVLIISLDPEANIESENTEAGFAQARRMLGSSPFLLVIDNADDRQSREVVLQVRRGLPQATLAITSHRDIWPDFLRIEVEGMKIHEAVSLFEQVYKKTVSIQEKSVIESWCRSVRGHPMMIVRLAWEASRGYLALKKFSLQPVFNIHRDLARRFNAARKRIPSKCHKLLELIGLLDTAQIRTDLAEQLGKVQWADLELLEDWQFIDLHSNGRQFTVHELIRAWCRKHSLQTKPEREKLRLEIAQFYLEFLRARRPEETDLFSEIDDEWPNVLGLIDSLSDPQAVLELVDEAIGDHRDDPNGYVPSRKQISSLLSRSSRLIDLSKQVGGLLAARIEKNLGHFFYWRADHDKAEELFLRALGRYRRNGHTVGEVATTWLLGYLADDENRYQEAYELYKSGTELAEKVRPDDPELVAIGYHLIGCTLFHQGRLEDAESTFSFARDLIQEQSSPHLLARIDRRLGSIAREFGRLEEAKKVLGKVTRLINRLERHRDKARIDRHLGLLYLQTGELERGEEALKRALLAFRELNAQRGVGYTLRALAILRRQQEDWPNALENCSKSLAIAKKTRSLFGEAAAYEEMANILEEKGEPAARIDRNRQRARNLYTVIGHKRSETLDRYLQETGAVKKYFPKDIRGVVFDLMDTLAYMEPGVYDRLQEHFARSLNVEAEGFRWARNNSRKQASTGRFKTTEERMRWLAEQLDAPLSDDLCQQLVEKEEGLWRNYVKLDPETLPLLKLLRQQKLRLAVLSNGPVAMDCLKESLGVTPYLQTFLLSSEIGRTKPDRRSYEKALEELGLEPTQCIFVGDGNDRELDGAREVGMFAIKKVKHSRPGYVNLKNQSLDWDLEVHSLVELQSLFAGKDETGS